MARRTTFSVRANQGGKLVTIKSPENVGIGNYLEKTNWRRLDDKEILREGTLLFRPNTGLAQGSQHLNLGATDVLGVWECVRPNDERSVVAATATTIYRYVYSTGTWEVVGSGFSAATTFWQSEQADGYLILNNTIDLPVSLRVEDANVVPFYEMRDQGIAAVGHISIYNGLLVCADITEIDDASLDTWMNGADPYGIVTGGITNRIKYELAWSDFGQPKNWAPEIGGVIESATKNKITLSRPAPYSFPVGSKLAISGAGPNGGILGGQVGYEDGIKVTAVSGRDVTIEIDADHSLTFPLQVVVTRYADTSTFVGRFSIKDDSSSITAIKPLKQILVVYRETGIWIGRYTGSYENPLQFKPAYTGANVPAYSRAIADVQGDYHLYATAAKFYYFDGAGDPRVHDVLDDCATLFFSGLTPSVAYKAFAVHNPITLEIWFHCPNGVLAYDYKEGTASWIDQAYGASAYVRRPGGTEYWFILALGGQVLQYGALAGGMLCIRRLGVAVTHSLKHGEVHLNDDENEKDLVSYMPLFSRVQNPVTVTLYGRDNISAAAETLLTQAISDVVNDPLIETFYRNIYFQDRVQYTSNTDDPVGYVGSTFTFDVIRSSGVTRN